MELKDPNKNDATFCIGFKFNGGDLNNPNNWRYDHVNYWTPGLDEEILENRISDEELAKTLSHYGQTLESLIDIYIDLISESRPE